MRRAVTRFNTRSFRPFRGIGIRAAFLIFFFCAVTHARQAPLIAAASSLQFALVDLQEAFQRESGRDIRLSFGSSGNLSRQIRQGAPYELFLSADEAFPIELHHQGFAENSGDIYAKGQLVLITPSDSPINGQDFLNAQTSSSSIKKFSIANPEHAPYGIAAREVLGHLGLWKTLTAKLVVGENVAQATQFVTSSNAEAGLVSLSLTLAPALTGKLSVTTVPVDLYRPIVKRMVLLPNASDTTKQFRQFILSPAGRQVLAEHGFIDPEVRQ